MGTGGDLLFRAVTRQVPSALKGLTSVFGMDTGDPLRLCHRKLFQGCAPGSYPPLCSGGEPVHPDNRTTSTSILISPAFLPVSSLVSPKSSPRPISTAKLHMLPCFHRRPIYPVVSRGPYFLLGMGTFVLRGASRLDAFSVYPVRTSLPCYAVGTTTVAPVVRPLRSSRTRSSSSHDSFAHDG